MPARVLEATPDAIAEGAELLRRGRLVAFPTETVYGLGANALDEHAVKGIFEAKGRPADDPLIVHVLDAAEVTSVARTRPRLQELAERFWPGPLTLVLPKLPAVPLAVTAGRETVAVRVPSHPVAHRLLRATGLPIAAPSANLFARPSPTTAAHVLHDLGERIDLILDGGATEVGVESTVLDLTGQVPTILRPGGVTAEQLRDVLGEVAEPAAVRNDSRSPGTAERHYSPRARVDLFERATDEQLNGHVADLARRGERAVVLHLDPDPVVAARSLYAALRDLDATNPEAIVTRLPPQGGLGAALRDRLRRAANGRVLRPPT